ARAPSGRTRNRTRRAPTRTSAVPRRARPPPGRDGRAARSRPDALAEIAGQLEVRVAAGERGGGRPQLEPGRDAVVRELRARQERGDRQGRPAVLQRVAREVMRERDEERVDAGALARTQRAARAERELADRDRRRARIFTGAARERDFGRRGELHAYPAAARPSLGAREVEDDAAELNVDG